MNILITIKVNILVLIQWSDRSPPLWTIEPKTVSKLRTRSPISFEHTSFRRLFLNPHLITYHSIYWCPHYYCVQLRYIHLTWTTLSMSRENKPLVTNEPVEFDNQNQLEFQTLRKLLIEFEESLEYTSIKSLDGCIFQRSQHVNSCTWKHVEFDRFVPKNLPGHWTPPSPWRKVIVVESEAVTS